MKLKNTDVSPRGEGDSTVRLNTVICQGLQDFESGNLIHF